MSQRVEDLVAKLTLDEKIAMVAGSDTWHGTGIDRLGIPAIKVTDGPNGARGETKSGLTSACFPCGSSLGSTWDVDLVTAVGEAIGQEARSKGAHLLLAPTINIHRTPLAGRNFECYSEDTLLTALLAIGYIEGVQSTGVGATAKHFVGNDSEFERHTISSAIDERTLREVYLRPFELVIERARPVSVMSAYNKVNGISASDNRELLTTILKDEWGFDGFVISDWYGTRTTVGAANAGLDLEMPGPPRVFGERLVEAVAAGDVDVTTIDDKARRILGALERTGAFEWHDEPETARDKPHHRELARAAATAGSVMLQNVGPQLPLDVRKLRHLAVIGPNANESLIHGGGSAAVKAHYAITPLQGLRDAVGPEVEVSFEPGCNIDRNVPPIDMNLLRVPGADPHQTGRWRAEYRRTDASPEDEPVSVKTPTRSRFMWTDEVAPGLRPAEATVRLSGTFRPDVSGEWSLGLISTGPSRLSIDGNVLVDAWSDWAKGSELYGNACDEVTATTELQAGSDYDLLVEFENARIGENLTGLTVGAAPPIATDLMARAVKLAERADAVVMVVGHNAEWETEGRDRESFALPGEQPELIAGVAAANPNTTVFINAGSPVDMTWAPLVPTIIYNWYPGQENGNSIADVVLGKSEPGGRLATTLPRRMRDTPSFGNYPGEFGEVRYGEGLLVGYRWYDTRDIEPAFPFGHGLGFTTFEWSQPRYDHAPETGSERIKVAVDVKNVGERAGADVVQVYAHRPTSVISRPDQQLVGFAKVHLEPAETRTVMLDIGLQELQHWDPEQRCWSLEPGPLELRMARSSRDVHAVARLDLST